MLDPIHPFPARMAPELAFDFLSDLPDQSVVLDPMCGSGVVLRSAVEAGHRPIGIDADPLAVLMSRVWVENSPHKRLSDYAENLVERARRYRELTLPWHRGEEEDETADFVKFWFGRSQRRDLARLALAIHRTEDNTPQYRPPHCSRSSGLTRSALANLSTTSRVGFRDPRSIWPT